MQFKFNYALRIGGQSFPAGVQDVPDAIAKSKAFALYRKGEWIVDRNSAKGPVQENDKQRGARLAAQLQIQREEAQERRKAEAQGKPPAPQAQAKPAMQAKPGVVIQSSIKA
jgi:hypothetical protein